MIFSLIIQSLNGIEVNLNETISDSLQIIAKTIAEMFEKISDQISYAITTVFGFSIKVDLTENVLVPIGK